MHVHDYAGGIVVHAASGIVALTGAMFPTHGLCGIIGTVLTGVFTYDFFAQSDSAMISRTEFFWNHILVLLMVFAYTFIMSYALYWITDKIVPMRVSKRNEQIGLDLSIYSS